MGTLNSLQLQLFHQAFCHCRDGQHNATVHRCCRRENVEMGVKMEENNEIGLNEERWYAEGEKFTMNSVLKVFKFIRLE